MSRVCDLLGVKVMSGHKVSHSIRRTNRKFVPNLKQKSFKSDVLGNSITLTIATKTLRTVTKYGSLDAFLINYKYAKLTDKARALRKRVKEALVKKGEMDKVKVQKEKKARRVSARKSKIAGKTQKSSKEKVAKKSETTAKAK